MFGSLWDSARAREGVFVSFPSATRYLLAGMTVLIIIWAVITVAVFVFAMRAGPLGHRESLPSDQSGLSQRAITLGIVVVFAFGLAVPAIVLAFNGEHKASEDVGVHLNASEVKGRELFAHSCTVCHTLAAVNAVGRIGPNLDVLVGGISSVPARRALVLSTILTGPAYGVGNMPADLYEGKEAEDVADFVAAVAGHH
jgi:mono/diheme cytochrome c family protein